jgi:hypothetical protein
VELVKYTVVALMLGFLGLSLSACFFEERGGGWDHGDRFRGGYDRGGYDHHYWR